MENETQENVKNKKWIEEPDGYLNKTPPLQFILVTILFALWAIAASLNDILITQFKAVFALSDFATAFVQSAFYGGYFVIAIPASIFIKKNSYKLGIIAGLGAFSLGCFLFFPASRLVTYQVFLFALFVEAIGLSFLETSANAYSSLLGPRKSATVRLNISQTMNAVGDIIGILLGKYLIFTDGNLKQEMASMSKEAAEQFGQQALARTLSPYKYVLIVLVIMIILFIITKFPSGKPKTSDSQKNATFKETMNYLSKRPRYWHGVAAQFIYMGVQTGVWSFTMRLALDMFPQFNERFVANFMLYSYICFFVGRFVASYLLSKFSETKVLMSYSFIGMLMILYITFVPNITAIYAAIGVSLVFGPCWPTIFARTLEVVDDKRHTETASAFIVMAIVGGAVLPIFQGLLSDFTTMQFSFIICAISMAIVFLYFVSEYKYDKRKA
ncbi:L-fucose:H+ symporter permease [Companilactobacillus halodurans]|uniref:L-fucose:H+ symporter permease n=1 Tax=Companilactobacillus halodurans TaxID=2584183 RepID=A0A5P0ZRN9_9LACO|nr:L-fucose:H+ symporter permease [Companilactobacillus halodurans]MQS76725.1 L-fucose:H+ symporter permease [Companilactobacillus halodurans]MQS98430.1 L-fucose:H+ symporter permease [Companilactobacillus halodurans]